MASTSNNRTPDPEPPEKSDKRYLGAIAMSVVIAGIGIQDQVTSGSVDKWTMAAMFGVFLYWGKENLAEFIRAWKGQ